MENERREQREIPKPRYVRLNDDDFDYLQQYAESLGGSFAGYSGMLIKREIERLKKLERVDTEAVK